uniref:Uncharacterized protein n=1 Tax=Mustela putorius furo TaxID=9669 RepID=M3YX18_MUSPF
SPSPGHSFLEVKGRKEGRRERPRASPSAPPTPAINKSFTGEAGQA